MGVSDGPLTVDFQASYRVDGLQSEIPDHWIAREAIKNSFCAESIPPCTFQL
jgi:hypothetical protein